MRSRSDPESGRCPRCALPGEPCLCPAIPTLRPTLEVVVLRHMLERLKSTNSARWAALALPTAQVFDWGLRDAPLDVDPLITQRTWVLFPAAQVTSAPRSIPERLIVVDGTWTQARRMLHRIPALRALPRLSLPPPPERRRLREQKHPVGMSTLEAIAGAYRLVGEPDVADELEGLFDRAVQLGLRSRGRRFMQPR